VLADAGSIPAVSTTEYAKPLIRQRFLRFLAIDLAWCPEWVSHLRINMAIRIASLLHRNRYGMLYFRMSIPADLQQHFGCKEIYRSLRTASITDATIAAQKLSIALRQAFAEFRLRTMSNAKKKSPPLSFSMELIVKHARETRYLRSRIEDAEKEAEDARDARRQDHQRNKETLELVVREAVREPKGPSVTFSQVAADHAREKLAKKAWTDTTAKDFGSVYALFVRIVGDLPIAEIEDDQIMVYLEKLKKLPPNINKNPVYIRKDIDEIIAQAPTECIAVRTINKNIERISGLFKWASRKRKYGVSYNPAANLSLDEDGLPKRLPFTATDLASLFSSEEFTTRSFLHPHYYWLMPLGLLTGARLGELCQLYVSNFMILDGIACLEISDTQEGQRVKNGSARRFVPVHEKLIELGLL